MSQGKDSTQKKKREKKKKVSWKFPNIHAVEDVTVGRTDLRPGLIPDMVKQEH